MCEQNKVNHAQEESYKHKAMNHDMSDVPEVDLKSAYHTIEENVVGAYQKIEDAVVGGYKKIEDSVVSGFTKMTDKIVDQFLAHEGETVEEAKKRMNGESQKAGK